MTATRSGNTEPAATTFTPEELAVLADAPDGNVAEAARRDPSLPLWKMRALTERCLVPGEPWQITDGGPEGSIVNLFRAYGLFTSLGILLTNAGIPTEILERVATYYYGPPLEGVTDGSGSGSEILHLILTHPNCSVGRLRWGAQQAYAGSRVGVAENPALPLGLLDILLADPEPMVVRAAARNTHVTPARLALMIPDATEGILGVLLEFLDQPYEAERKVILGRLMGLPYPAGYTRGLLAFHSDDEDRLALLCRDEFVDVRWLAAINLATRAEDKIVVALSDGPAGVTPKRSLLRLETRSGF